MSKYVYVVRLGSGPIFAILKVRFLTNFVLDVFPPNTGGDRHFLMLGGGAKKLKENTNFHIDENTALNIVMLQTLTRTKAFFKNNKNKK